MQASLLRTEELPTARILGIPMHCVSMTQAVERVAAFVRAGEPRLLITLGVEMVMHARHDDAFRDVARQADLLVPDSIGVVWAARRQGFNVERVAGIDLLDRLAERGVREGWRFYFLGGQPEVARAAADRLIERHPGMCVAGCRDGYFREDAEVVAQVRQAAPQVLLVGLGSPRQELWARRHAAELGVPVTIGVGGSFDVLAGRLQRAPVWMRRTGLEWLYRLVTQPARLIRMLVLPHFAWIILTTSPRADRSRA